MFPYIDMSDKALLSLLSAGDDKAFAEIYNRYWSVLYLYACKFSGHNDQAEDIVQEVFVALWNKSGELELQTSLAAYLYTSVRYKIFDLIDHEKVKAKYLASFGAYLNAEKTIADSAILEKELLTEIESAIQLLPAKMRQVFELSRKNGLSQKEIAVQLNISDKTVKKQVSNAMRILRLKLGILSAVLLFF